MQSRIRSAALTALLFAAPALAQFPTGSTSDPRAALKPGMYDAQSLAKNMKLVSSVAKPELFHPQQSLNPGALTWINSDLAFHSHYVIQGNFSGFMIWDMADPAKPVLKTAFYCPSDQADPSVLGDLLFISAESRRSRIDCTDSTMMNGPNKARVLGLRIFNIADVEHPKQVAVVQNCRGSHTHTLLPDPKNKNVTYVYLSGTAGVRSADELAGCSQDSSTFRTDIIRVPLDHPDQSKIVSGGRFLDSLLATAKHGNSPGDTTPARRGGGAGANGRGRGAGAAGDSTGRGRGGAADSGRGAGRGRGAGGAGAGGPGTPPANRGLGGPNQCHDITLYPAMQLGAGACASYGVLFSTKDPEHPKRIAAVSDTNFEFWHSATFSNDGTKLLYSDEWGGGQAPRCRSIDPINWGGDALFTIKGTTLTAASYYKIPQAQTDQENCVAHNGALIPVPGRDIMSQGWYQGGVSVFDFSDVKHPYEIAYFDRGPITDKAMVIGGYWCAYWYNGYIYASELARGLDVFELQPSEFLSQNEIDAAKLVKWVDYNPQSQPKIVWPAAFPVVRSYLDQLVRDKGLAADKTSKIGGEIDAAEKQSGGARASALNKVASELDGDAAGAADGAKVKTMAAAVRDLAKAK